MYASSFRDVFVDDNELHPSVWRMDYLARQAAFGESGSPKGVACRPAAKSGRPSGWSDAAQDKCLYSAAATLLLLTRAHFLGRFNAHISDFPEK